MTDPAYGYVTIAPVRDGSPVTVRLDSGRPAVSSRPGSGWSEVERPKRVSTSEWTGHALERMDLAIILDGWSAREDQLGKWNQLREMGIRQSGQPHPPELRIAGNVPGTALRWVMVGLDPSSDAIVGVNGELWRQPATLHLMEFNPATIAVRPSAVNGAPRHYTLHTVKRGETLEKIAVTYFGSTKAAKAIAQAQTPPIRSVRAKLKAGKVLRIP